MMENGIHVSHRRGSGIDQPAAAGELVVIGDFAGDAGIAGGGRGFEREHAWAWRSCAKFVLRGRAADYGPDQQSVFEPDSGGFDPVAGSDFRRASCGIWRQDQPGDQGDYKIGAGGEEPDGERDDFVWKFRDGFRGVQPGLRRREMGELHHRERAEQRAIPGSAGIYGDTR